MKLLINSKNQEFEVLVDEDIYLEFQHRTMHLKTYKDTKPYAQFKSGGKNIKLHRHIMAVTDRKLVVDHINGNTLDNRRINLRICTQFDNMKNTFSRKNSSSQYLGVSWNKTLGYWVAEVRSNGKRVYCGYFNNELDAAKARDEQAKIHHKEYVRLNFE